MLFSRPDFAREMSENLPSLHFLLKMSDEVGSQNAGLMGEIKQPNSSSKLVQDVVASLNGKSYFEF